MVQFIGNKFIPRVYIWGVTSMTVKLPYFTNNNNKAACRIKNSVELRDWHVTVFCSQTYPREAWMCWMSVGWYHQVCQLKRWQTPPCFQSVHAASHGPESTHNTTYTFRALCRINCTVTSRKWNAVGTFTWFYNMQQDLHLKTSTPLTSI